MTELVLSEITRMKWGHCVIGLESIGQGFRSIRPLPPRGNAWPAPFVHARGSRLRFSLSRIRVEPPHMEDRSSTGILGIMGTVTEIGLVNCLRRAEVAQELKDLFGCEVRETRHSGRLYVKSGEGDRSICGCEFLNIRLERVAGEMRAFLTLPSGETLRDLPVVDHDWNHFIELAEGQMSGVNRSRQLNRFLRDQVQAKLLNDPNHFVRIGLSRPFKAGCWLMLDSLFPLPQSAWLDDLDRAA